MLAESAKQWTQESEKKGLREGFEKEFQDGFKKGFQEGFKKGRQEGFEEALQVTRDILLSQMTKRFGPVPTKLRRKVQGLKEADELKKLGSRLLVVSSLEDLGL